MVKRISLEDAERDYIKLTVFKRGGGQENVGLPTQFVLKLIKDISDNGYTAIQLSGGRAFEVTGILFGSEEFREESRIIVIGQNNHMD